MQINKSLNQIGLSLARDIVVSGGKEWSVAQGLLSPLQAWQDLKDPRRTPAIDAQVSIKSLNKRDHS